MNIFHMLMSIYLLLLASWVIHGAMAENAEVNLSLSNESDPVYWYNKGHELQNSSKYNESIEASNKAIELDPNSEEAWFGKGIALRALHRDSEADAALAEGSKPIK